MKNKSFYAILVVPIALFVLKLINKILFSEGKQIEIKTPSALDKSRKM